MPFGLDDDAKLITQDLLDRSGNAMMTNDFEAMKSCFLLPQGFSTLTGTEWRVASSDYAVEPGTTHSRALSGAPTSNLVSGNQL